MDCVVSFFPLREIRSADTDVHSLDLRCKILAVQRECYRGWGACVCEVSQRMCGSGFGGVCSRNCVEIWRHHGLVLDCQSSE